MLTRFAALAALAAATACGPSPELQRARERAAAVTEPPPAYEGVTECVASGPMRRSDVVGFGFGFPSDSPAPRIDVHGSLDKELIARPIRARAASFRRCYEELLVLDPDAEGGVTAKFQIRADGTIAWAQIHGWDPRLDACMCDEVLRLAFPKFGAATVERILVSYPFVFARHPQR